MACYTLFVPLRTTMMISAEAPEGSSKKKILESVTRNDLMNADTEICWDDIKDSFRSVETEAVWGYDEEGDEVLN